jgi:hypothetical protein
MKHLLQPCKVEAGVDWTLCLSRVSGRVDDQIGGHASQGRRDLVRSREIKFITASRDERIWRSKDFKECAADLSGYASELLASDSIVFHDTKARGRQW